MRSTITKIEMLQLTKTLHFECARPGATEAGKCQGEKNPVWTRVSLGHSVIWYSNLFRISDFDIQILPEHDFSFRQ